MSDIEQIALTTATTLFGGVLLFILGEFIRTKITLPIQKLNEQIQIVLAGLDFYCNLLTNYYPSEPSKEQRKMIHEMTRDLRKSATQLKSMYLVISLKYMLIKFRMIPSVDRIETGHRGLIYLHNSVLYERERKIVVNQIDMNNNEISRIRAALMNEKIPDIIMPKEKERYGR